MNQVRRHEHRLLDAEPHAPHPRHERARVEWSEGELGIRVLPGGKEGESARVQGVGGDLGIPPLYDPRGVAAPPSTGWGKARCAA